MDRNFSIRETINSTFDRVRALADAVVLEFGPSRAQDLALRDRIRTWQAELRTLFITRTALWKYRMRLPGFTVPDAVVSAQTEFDNEVANTLESVADCLEGKASGTNTSSMLGEAFDRLQETAQIQNSGTNTDRPAQFDTFVVLCRNTERLITSLNADFCSTKTL
jgi:multidrug resistance protein MdtO